MSNENATIRAFLSENSKLFDLINELEKQKERAASQYNTVRHDMKEFTNALACLSGLGKILERPDLELDKAIKEVLDLIPLAWQHPDETAARITCQGHEYKTSNFIVETQWRFGADIMVGGEPKGRVEIFYLEEKAPDFIGMQIWENDNLMGAFAAGIGLLFERHQLTVERDAQANVIKKAQDKNKHNSVRLSKAIAKLRSMKEQSEDTERRMHWLLASISSELRTMLVGMTGLAGKGLETACREIAEPLRQIKAEAENAIRTTNRIYDYANISNGKFRHNNTEFRLRDVMENAIDQFYDQSRKKNADLIVIVDPFVPNRVIGDGNRLSQILTYLIENALTRSGEGEVVIRVNVEVSAHMLPVFHFVIVDNGPGIATETKDRLFDLCSDDTKTLAKGNLYTRLGAAIAKHMVEILGGEIWVEERKDNTEGNEIHFTMWLDVVKGQQNTPDGNGFSTLGGSRILVADGSKTYRELYQLLLEYWGVEATIVSTGHEAADRIKIDIESKSPYAAVIIDSALPDMDGYEIADQIHSDDHDNKPCVIMTLFGDWPPDEDRSRSLGIAAALGKPICQAALQEALTAVIREKTWSEKSSTENTEQPEPTTADQHEICEEPGEATDQSQRQEEPDQTEDQDQLQEEPPEAEDQSQHQEEPDQTIDQSQLQEEPPEAEDQSQHQEEPDQTEDQPQLQEKPDEAKDQDQLQEMPDEAEDQPQIQEKSDEAEEKPKLLEKPDEAEGQPQLLEAKTEDQPQLQEQPSEKDDQPQLQDNSGETEEQPQPAYESSEKDDQPQLQQEISETEDQHQEEQDHSENQPRLEEQPSKKNDQPKPQEASNKTTILLYDNGKDPRREMAVKLMRKHGYTVVTAASGSEMLEKINSGKSDIAFIDTVMSDMYGLDVVKSVRDTEKSDIHHLPLIAVAPANSGIDRQAGMNAGFDDFLNEPIAINRLIEIIESHCPKTVAAKESNEGQPQPVMHFDREKALNVVDNDPGMLTDVIDIFEDDCATHIAAIKDSLEASDYGKVIDVSEKLHEAAKHIGAMRISGTAEQLAGLSFPDNADQANELIKTLNEEFAEFRKIASAFLRTTIV